MSRGVTFSAKKRSMRHTGTLLALTLLLLSFVCSTFLVQPTHAATVARNPTLVDHFGDPIPLTLYVRLQRQIQKSFLDFGGPEGDELILDEGEVDENAEGQVVANPENYENEGNNNNNNFNDMVHRGTALVTPNEWQVKDFDLPVLGATPLKHRSQIVRNLPPSYGPRFGINRAVTLKANTTLRAAGATLMENPALQQSALAMRFSVGRGLQKESTWLPLATRHKVVSMLAELLGNRMEALREAGAMAKNNGGGDGAAAHELHELEAELGDLTTHQKDPLVHYLTKVTFYFGYQRGEEQHKITSFSIDARYSPVPRPGIELHYLWDEHRPYNPNRALLFCSAASLLVAMMMALVVFHPSSRSMLLFSQRIVAVRAHE